MKREQNRHAVLDTVNSLADSRIALDKKPVVRKRAHAIEAFEVSSHLRLHATREIPIAGLEHPARV